MDATPARHTQGGEMVPPTALDVGTWDKYDPKGEIHKKISNLVHVVNAVGTCLFAYSSYPYEYIPDFLTAVTGRTYSVEDCYKIGERIANLRHAFNLREGLNPLTFKYPDRMVGRPPLTHGNNRGVTVDIERQNREFCEAMGWDTVTARPSAQRLSELGLDFVAKESRCKILLVSVGPGREATVEVADPFRA
jgi:aldehyde:ferredoxin oxidoreductase